jgi:hypothetical protein
MSGINILHMFAGLSKGYPFKKRVVLHSFLKQVTNNELDADSTAF